VHGRNGGRHFERRGRVNSAAIRHTTGIRSNHRTRTMGYSGTGGVAEAGLAAWGGAALVMISRCADDSVRCTACTLPHI
jgi:hypothetical protein